MQRSTPQAFLLQREEDSGQQVEQGCLCETE